MYLVHTQSYRENELNLTETCVNDSAQYNARLMLNVIGQASKLSPPPK
jgi:hypothetical protein